MKSSLGKFLVLFFAFLPVFVSGNANHDGSAFTVKYGEKEKIDKYNICSIVHNRASGTKPVGRYNIPVYYELFIPAATKQEWRSFVDTYSDFKLGKRYDFLTGEPYFGCVDSDICLSDCPIESILNDTGVTSALSVQTFDNGNPPIKTLRDGCRGYKHNGQDCDYGLDAKPNSETDGKAGFSFTRLDKNGNNYSDSGDYDQHPWPCVKDNNTGLVWEVDLFTDQLMRAINYEARNRNRCGYTDWRVPHITEVVGLLNYSSYGKNPIDVDYFPVTTTGTLWTSTQFPGQEDKYIYYFPYGTIQSSGKEASSRKAVRLVRGYARNGIGDGLGGMPSGRFDYGDRGMFSSTVSDTYTGLMWQRCSVGQTWSQLSRECDGTAREFAGYAGWGQALEEAEDSNFAGYTDWRVPNVKELQSIVNYEKYDPAISTDVFPNTESFHKFNDTISYWSSTPASRNHIYSVRFDVGIIYLATYDWNYPLYVRLVRDNPPN